MPPFGFLLYLLVAVVITALALWVNSEIPYDPTVKRIVRIVSIVFFCIWLLYFVVGAMPAWGPPVYHR